MVVQKLQSHELFGLQKISQVFFKRYVDTMEKLQAMVQSVPMA